MRVTGHNPSSASISEHAAAWIAVRDACPVGREGRYSDAQLEYHYTKARGLLR
jgi:hypothetical protein